MTACQKKDGFSGRSRLPCFSRPSIEGQLKTIGAIGFWSRRPSSRATGQKLSCPKIVSHNGGLLVAYFAFDEDDVESSGCVPRRANGLAYSSSPLLKESGGAEKSQDPLHCAPCSRARSNPRVAL